MVAKVFGVPQITVNGSNYSCDVPVNLYDDAGWIGEGTTLTITGTLTDTGVAFINKLKMASDNWQATLAIRDTFQNKLNGLVGRVL
jgi:hypothetical protein